MNLLPTKGNEQRHKKGNPRPCLVISDDEYNGITRDPFDLIIAIPMSTTIRKDFPFHISFKGDEVGMKKDGALLCDQIRTLSRERFQSQAGEVTNSELLRLVSDRVMVLIGFYT